jgi:hypothetical protein
MNRSTWDGEGAPRKKGNGTSTFARGCGHASQRRRRLDHHEFVGDMLPPQLIGTNHFDLVRLVPIGWVVVG